VPRPGLEFNLSNHRSPRKGTSRRVLLTSAVVGTVAVVSGRALRSARADTIVNGVDYSFGRPRPSALRAAGYTFACRYLSHTPTNAKNLTLAEAKALIAAGVDIVCNWETSTGDALSGQGVTYAREAANQAWACGIPKDRPIYFSVDFDAQPADMAAIDVYFDAIASVLGRGRTGAYGGYKVIKHLFDTGRITYGWQTFAWSAGLWDSRAQLRQVQNNITVDGAACDRDEAWAADFGQWNQMHGQPGPGPSLGGVTLRPAG
jgi:hypothetical protein